MEAFNAVLYLNSYLLNDLCRSNYIYIKQRFWCTIFIEIMRNDGFGAEGFHNLKIFSCTVYVK